MRGDQPTPASALDPANTMQLAASIFEHLAQMTPLAIPHVRPFSDPDALEEWRRGAKIPELLQEEFFQWFQAVKLRGDRIEENKRRLRTTLWAQAVLECGGHSEYAQPLADFHRNYWRVPAVPAECWEREAVVGHVVSYLSQGAR